VQATYQGAVPHEAFVAANTYELTYDVNANFSSEQSEEFEVLVDLDPMFGSATVDMAELILSPPEESMVLVVSVTPSGAVAEADLSVVVRSVLDPDGLRSTQMPVRLRLGELPPGARYYHYAGPLSGPAFGPEVVFEIPQDHLTRPSGRSVPFELDNTSLDETRTYRIRSQIIPDTLDNTGWEPLDLVEISDSPVIVAAQSSAGVLARVRADSRNSPAVDTRGEIVSTAELIEVDGEPIAGAQPLVVRIPFVVGEP